MFKLLLKQHSFSSSRTQYNATKVSFVNERSDIKLKHSKHNSNKIETTLIQEKYLALLTGR